MKLAARLSSMTALREYLSPENEYLQAVMHRTFVNNPWFTVENQKKAIGAIVDEFLDREKLEKWVSGYQIDDGKSPKTIGLVMAGNIPLVGFHDVLSVFISGHKAKIKLSEKDKYLLPYILDSLEKIDSRTKDYFEIVERLSGFEAVITTGSNNSARYFDAYFSKYPHIIRRNKNAVAVLTGDETDDELRALGKDVFSYFGLGCRSISKIYVPEGYDFEKLLEIFHERREIILHDKYKNNFDYNYALLVLNRTPYLNNGCIILTENPAIQSRIAALHYEFYYNETALMMNLEGLRGDIQCVVSKKNIADWEVVAPGKAQRPAIDDYADGVDTMKFLTFL